MDVKQKKKMSARGSRNTGMVLEYNTESFDIANFDDIEGVSRVKNISGQWGFMD